MGYRAKTPNFSLAATAVHPGTRNDELNTTLRDVHARLDLLEQTTGAQGINLKKQAPQSPTPVSPGLTVNAAANSGLWRLRIVLPEFTSPAGRGNAPRMPLYHQVQYSPYRDFSSQVGEQAIGHDVNHTIFGNSGQTLHFRVRSSVDGLKWSPWVLSAPVRA